MDIKDAFNSSALEYDKHRRQFIPCFDDFYGTVLKLIPYEENDTFTVLDLGAGTGLLSQMILNIFPKANIVLMDFAQDMMKQAMNRFLADKKYDKSNITYSLKDYSKDEITLKGNPYDLIVSALSIHHLTSIEKQKLFSKIYHALNPEGLFINADLCLGYTEDIEQEYQNDWLAHLAKSGLSSEEIQAGIERSKFDKKDTLSNQLMWLDSTGFVNVNCWYSNFSFSVYSGQKL